MNDHYTKAKRAASDTDDETWKRGGVTPTLNAIDNTGDTRATVLVAFSHYSSDPQPGDIVPTLRAGTNVTGHAVFDGGTDSGPATQVRRLTPVECERLQGFPDNWTDGQADSARYKQMGNAVAVPVVDWIMRRLVAADEESI